MPNTCNAPLVGKYWPDAKFYFPVNKDASRRNVESQRKQAKSILSTVRKLTKLRKANPSLGIFGNIRHLHLEKDSRSYIYSRYGKGDAFVLCLNPSDTPRSISVAIENRMTEFKHKKALVPEICSSRSSAIALGKKVSFELPGNYFGLFRIV